MSDHVAAAMRESRVASPSSDELFDLLNAFAGWSVSDKKFDREFQRKFGEPSNIEHGPTTRERIDLAKRIEDVFRRGAVWPKMRGLRSDGSDAFWFTPSSCGQKRPRTERPRDDYCLRWNGMIWVPCRTIKERREAGYVGLMMCWPPPLPKAGAYITSGERARFVYRIAEVERFKPPRGAKRYTCRLWCERVLPEDVPRAAPVHTFFWHPRARSKR